MHYFHFSERIRLASNKFLDSICSPWWYLLDCGAIFPYKWYASELSFVIVALKKHDLQVFLLFELSFFEDRFVSDHFN